jgi:hypothetical protein
MLPMLVVRMPLLSSFPFNSLFLFLVLLLGVYCIEQKMVAEFLL